jgi:hypothetical protein
LFLLELGVEAVPALDKALHRGDYQTRQYAAEVLDRLDDEYEPSIKFLEVLVEGMAHDDYPNRWSYDHKRFEPLGSHIQAYMQNAYRGLNFFRNSDLAYVELAMPFLTAALGSTDGQQRFLSALVLAEHAVEEYAGIVAPILVAHLADNRLATDAGNAAPALANLGDSARPYLERAKSSSDAQQAELASKILEQIDTGKPIHFAGRRLFSAHNWVPEHFPHADGTYDVPPRAHHEYE